MRTVSVGRDIASESSASNVAPMGSARITGSRHGAVDWAAMQRFWIEAAELRGIDTGPSDSTKRMLMFFDPNCPACARQWQVVKPYLQSVRIHWIPVAYIDPSSQRLAAAILAAPDPAKALAENEDRYDFRRERGGYLPPANVPKWAINAVREDTLSPAFTRPVSATPMWGMELYPGKRYYRSYGVIDARGMSIVVKELGSTMDPHARAAQLKGRVQPVPPRSSGRSPG